MRDFADVARTVMENGRAANQAELKNEFEFEASEQGWTDEEIQEAINSPFFPVIDNE